MIFILIRCLKHTQSLLNLFVDNKEIAIKQNYIDSKPQIKDII
jgi:hypothetical protein